MSPRPAAPQPPEAILVVDVGSTYTKAALVQVSSTAGEGSAPGAETGTVLGRGEAPTTLDTDVMDGVRWLATHLGDPQAVEDGRILACSSAGGGLRLAVLGYERTVTAEAGYRVGLSAGAKVVHVASGPLDGEGLTALSAARPDIVLLVGGTDGGNATVLLHNARALAGARGPVVAVTDYLKLVPEQIARWVPGGLVPLGTDGFGRSESRAALRRHFEVDAESIALAAAAALARRGEVEPALVLRVRGELGLDPEHPDPARA